MLKAFSVEFWINDCVVNKNLTETQISILLNNKWIFGNIGFMKTVKAKNYNNAFKNIVKTLEKLLNISFKWYCETCGNNYYLIINEEV